LRAGNERIVWIRTKRKTELLGDCLAMKSSPALIFYFHGGNVVFILAYFLGIKFMGGDPAFFLRPGYKAPQINENPQYSNIQPMNNSCRIIKDTSDSWIKNDKMECN
jgi:hypothetical protein